MVIVDSVAAQMKVGDRLTFIMTNEIHNIDLFWQSGISGMIICGFVAL